MAEDGFHDAGVSMRGVKVNFVPPLAHSRQVYVCVMGIFEGGGRPPPRLTPKMLAVFGGEGWRPGLMPRFESALDTARPPAEHAKKKEPGATDAC